MECTGKEIMGKNKVPNIVTKKIIRFASGTRNAKANYSNDFFVKILNLNQKDSYDFYLNLQGTIQVFSL